MPERTRQNFLRLALLLLLVLPQFFFGQKIETNEGLGYDGVLYAKFARAFAGDEAIGGFNRYSAQRVLPSAIVGLGLRALSIERTPSTIYWGFRTLNLVAILLAFGCFLACASLLELDTSTTWLTFFAVFCNHPILRHGFFNPVITDVAAFFFSLASFWAWLARRDFLLLLFTLASAFVWPSSLALNLVLFVFPRGSSPLVSQLPGGRWPRILFASAVVLASVVFLFVSGRYGRIAPTPFRKLLLPASYAAVFAYAWLASGIFLVGNPLPLLWSRAFWVQLARRAFPALAVVFLVRSLLDRIATHEQLLTVSQFLTYNLLLRPIVRPGMFVFINVIYFSPFLLLLLWYRREIGEWLAREGVGVVLFVAGVLLLGLDTEARVMTFGFPALVLILGASLRPGMLGERVVWVFGGLALLLSRFWLPYPKEVIGASIRQSQWVMINFGPAVTDLGYAIAGALSILAGGLLFWARPRTISPKL